MKRSILMYFLSLAGVLIPSFLLLKAIFLHNNISPTDVLLGWAFLLNAVLAFLIILFIFIFKNRFFAQIGFLFMVGSMLKFLVFFLVFYPVYMEDGQLSRIEFISFFIPYALSLVIETIAVSRLLNKGN